MTRGRAFLISGLVAAVVNASAGCLSWKVYDPLDPGALQLEQDVTVILSPIAGTDLMPRELVATPWGAGALSGTFESSYVRALMDANSDRIVLQELDAPVSGSTSTTYLVRPTLTSLTHEFTAGEVVAVLLTGILLVPLAFMGLATTRHTMNADLEIRVYDVTGLVPVTGLNPATGVHQRSYDTATLDLVQLTRTTVSLRARSGGAGSQTLEMFQGLAAELGRHLAAEVNAALPR
jgi:hypothetical protein